MAGLGIALMDPVALDRPAWSFADHAAGPNAGARASCAAVVAAGEAAARQGVTSGETSFVLSTQRVFGWVGLSTALVQLSPINELYLADDGRDTRAMSTVSNSALRRAFRALTSRVTADSVNIFAPAVQFVASAVETVHNSEANDLMRWVARGASVRGAAMGPDRDASAFVAHMDEVGFEVDRILPDGHGTLRRLGGAVTCSWEGVPARLHLEPDGNGRTRETLRGVFVPRSAGRVKTPDRLTAWFGLDSAQLVSRGVERGFSITAYKRAERLAGTRVTARGTDDRAGSAALLAALLALDTTKLNRRVYFTWTTAEEVGLRGAVHLATHPRAMRHAAATTRLRQSAVRSPVCIRLTRLSLPTHRSSRRTLPLHRWVQARCCAHLTIRTSCRDGNVRDSLRWPERSASRCRLAPRRAAQTAAQFRRGDRSISD